MPIKKLLHGAVGAEDSDEGEGDEDDEGGTKRSPTRSKSERRREDEKAAQAALELYTGTLKDRREKQGIKVSEVYGRSRGSR